MPRPGSGNTAGVNQAVATARSFGIGDDDDVWDDDEDNSISPCRRRCRALIENSYFKTAITTIILLNVALIVHETDTGATCELPDAPADCGTATFFVRLCNLTFLVVYTLEMCIRIYVFRLAYFCSTADLFDAIIVLFGIAGEIVGGALPGIAILRLFRVARVARALRVTYQIDELKIFISGIGSAGKAIFIGSGLIFLFTFLWSIIAVMLIHPINQDLANSGVHAANGCDRCEVAYSSVVESMLTILQTVVMADAWGDFTVPIIEAAPWTAMVFVTMSFSTSLCLTNLILAVIIDKALENRDLNLKRQAAQRRAMLEAARAHYVLVCKKIDIDKNGFLTLEELLDGFEHPEIQPVLELLDINQDDMGTVFEMMDKDGNGSISYDEFSYQLCNLKTQDIHTMVAFIKYYVMTVQANLKNEIEVQEKRFKAEMSALKHEGAAPVVEANPSIPASGPTLHEVQLTLSGQLQDMRRGLEDQVTSLRNGLLQDLELSSTALRDSLLLDGGHVSRRPEVAGASKEAGGVKSAGSLRRRQEPCLLRGNEGFRPTNDASATTRTLREIPEAAGIPLKRRPADTSALEGGGLQL